VRQSQIVAIGLPATLDHGWLEAHLGDGDGTPPGH